MSLNPEHIAKFCANTYGQALCPIIGAHNIVYIEGLNPDGSLNADAPNRWNDLRLIVSNSLTGWKLSHIAVATTEPGNYYTKNPMHPDGCARIAFGYHPPAWKRGFHKGVQPALVQVKEVSIHRDKNRDGLRNRIEKPFLAKDIGLNHHTTNKRFNGDTVGMQSAGCLVGKLYENHLKFLSILEKDCRIVPGQVYLYDTWVLPGDIFIKSTKDEKIQNQGRG